MANQHKMLKKRHNRLEEKIKIPKKVNEKKMVYFFMVPRK